MALRRPTRAISRLEDESDFNKEAVMKRKSPHPSWRFSDSQIDDICSKAWDRLPQNVRSEVTKYVNEISDVPEWSHLEKQNLATHHLRRNPACFNSSNCGERWIHFCIEDCRLAVPDAITGALAHEVAHAYQEKLTPEAKDWPACEEAGDLLPSRDWGFSCEIEALRNYRNRFNGLHVSDIPIPQ